MSALFKKLNLGTPESNTAWRVIYSVEADVMIVQVVRVTPHDYRKH